MLPGAAARGAVDASATDKVRPSTSGVDHNNQPWRPVLKDAVTSPQHFPAAGSHVVGGAILHNRSNDLACWQSVFPEKASPSPEALPAKGIPRTSYFDWGPVDVDGEAMGDHKVLSWAIDELQTSHDRPDFLAVGRIRPHLPWFVPRNDFDQPLVTTHGRGNHAVRSERWRSIRDSDGDEELHDHDADPREWSNLASDPKPQPVKAERSAWLPSVNAPDAPRAGQNATRASR